MYVDQRQPRVTLDSPVTVMPSDGLVQHGRIRNLSRGGAFIVDLGQLPPVSAQVHLAFALPRGPAVEADATVLRSVPSGDPEEPTGIAVQFNDEDPGALGAFVRDNLEPGDARNKVRLRLETHGAVITARARHEEDGVLTLECDLPFLCIGSNVHLQRAWEDAPVQTGVLSWVSAQAPPGSAYPRIHLGISLGTTHGDPTPDRLPLEPRRHTGRQDPTNLVSTAPPMPPPLVQPRRRRQRWWLSAGLGAVLGVALVAGAALLYEKQPEPTTPIVEHRVVPIGPAPTAAPAVPVATEAFPEMLPGWWPPAALVSEAIAAAAPAPRTRVRPRTLSWGRRNRAVRRHLAMARKALKQNRPAVARRHALKALSLDPANEHAEALVAKARKDTPDS
jgi:hypothetical protein